jgi:hypothetical protein
VREGGAGCWRVHVLVLVVAGGAGRACCCWQLLHSMHQVKLLYILLGLRQLEAMYCCMFVT